jgi:hypothetical protein
MKEIWRKLPWWVRNVVVPLIVVIALWNILSAVFGLIFGIVGLVLVIVIKLLVIAALGAAVVVLVKKAAR